MQIAQLNDRDLTAVIGGARRSGINLDINKEKGINLTVRLGGLSFDFQYSFLRVKPPPADI